MFFAILGNNKSESQKHYVELYISYYGILLCMWFDPISRNG